MMEDFTVQEADETILRFFEDLSSEDVRDVWAGARCSPETADWFGPGRGETRKARAAATLCNGGECADPSSPRGKGASTLTYCGPCPVRDLCKKTFGALAANEGLIIAGSAS